MTDELFPRADLARSAAGEAINAHELLSAVASRYSFRLESLVAETGLWANPEVHRRLLTGGSAAFYPNRRRYRPGHGESRGQKIGILILDDNTYANVAIKRAIGVAPQDLIGFEACHIWPLTCYDARYHTAVANIVLLPRAVAGMTDHSREVQLALQYRAFSLYGWHPEDRDRPVEPTGYPSSWREPMPFSDNVEIALAKRTLKNSAGSSDNPQGYRTEAVRGRGRDYTRYDVNTREKLASSLPKCIAMFTLIKALVDEGISPEDICAAVPDLGNRLFRSAPGQLNSEGFIAAVRLEWRKRGKSFDPIRYFCQTDRLMYFAGVTFAVSSQWGGWTEKAIADLLQAFPDCGVSVKPVG